MTARLHIFVKTHWTIQSKWEYLNVWGMYIWMYAVVKRIIDNNCILAKILILPSSTPSHLDDLISAKYILLLEYFIKCYYLAKLITTFVHSFVLLTQSFNISLNSPFLFLTPKFPIFQISCEAFSGVCSVFWEFLSSVLNSYNMQSLHEPYKNHSLCCHGCYHSLQGIVGAYMHIPPLVLKPSLP